MHDFRRLEVWQESMALAEDLYITTSHLPKEETYGLKAQMRRSAISVAANIAEGAGRGSPADMARFLRNSLGSVAELETHVELAARTGLLEPQPELLKRLNDLRRRLRALHNRILEE